jgi:molecular chaperone DnaJ
MATPNHYNTLEVSPQATQAEIKTAYRRLAKLFHPDSNRETENHEDIARINVAYEVLSDPESRRSYDSELRYQSQLEAAGFDATSQQTRQQRNAAAQRQYQQRQTGQDADEQFDRWVNRIYAPVNRELAKILNALQDEIDDLSADPFDDELMENFQNYLEDCRDSLAKAQMTFRSMPNPPSVAGVAAHLYYCLNQVGDGIEELNLFTMNYDDHYLHTGQELFRIANQLRREAQSALKQSVASR